MFVDVFFMIVGYDAAKNCLFLEIHNWGNWLDCNVGNFPRIVAFYIFLTGARLNNLPPDNIMGFLKIETEMCMWK